jgi:two-component system, cell cycle response regulator DivK
MPRVLLVEDNEMNRDMLSRRLARRGFEVVTVVDGLQGMEAARRLRPDIILMDMSLPLIDGWETTRRIKADPETCAIPVVALTAHAQPRDRDEALAAGCNDHDTKPVEFERLLEKMALLLGSATDRAAARECRD